LISASQRQEIQPRRQAGLLALLLVLSTLAVYYPVRHLPFINYDDDLYVTENVRVQSGLERDTSGPHIVNLLLHTNGLHIDRMQRKQRRHHRASIGKSCGSPKNPKEQHHVPRNAFERPQAWASETDDEHTKVLM
jgi:hypothetical protein